MVEDRRLSASTSKGLTPSSVSSSSPDRAMSREETHGVALIGSCRLARGTSRPCDSLRNRVLLESLRLELRFSQPPLPLVLEELGELSTVGLLSLQLPVKACCLRQSFLQLPLLFLLHP